MLIAILIGFRQALLVLRSAFGATFIRLTWSKTREESFLRFPIAPDDFQSRIFIIQNLKTPLAGSVSDGRMILDQPDAADEFPKSS